MDVNKAINQFLEEKGADERYASFDYCYDYFYSFYKQNRIVELANKKNLQMSCLQLGFYLASWGMMRGSSFLLIKKSVRHHQNLINAISKMKPKMWEIDVDNYNEENIKLLLDCKQKIIEALGKENKPSDILITKIMLGVFANIPAFDQNFKKSLEVNAVNEKSLMKIKEFYEKNKSKFDSHKIKTLDFLTAKKTGILYTKAKLVDMYGFIDGQNRMKKPNPKLFKPSIT
ncbi:MAG: hypothetical protein Q7S21_03675 [archaeon]|nr:hypothetical protein [archaeon]